MKRYLVKWRELRYVDCEVEVEAESAMAAKKLAQDYEVDVDMRIIK